MNPAPTPDAGTRIVMCSKSRWHPAIRREHALAMTASAQGVSVDFVEKPTDVRRLRHPRALVRATPDGPGLRVVPRFSPVPAYRDGLARRVNTAGLRRTLGRLLGTGATPDAVVVNTPWDWPATASVPTGTRRVLDLADDWATLIPRQAGRIRDDYRRIGQEADTIIVASPGLADLFDREVVVVANATAAELLDTPPTPPPGVRRMVYVGTLSERFDAALVADVLRRLPDWSLDLYGPCHYAGHGAEPGDELLALLAEFGNRVVLHGLVPRERLSAALDGGDVLVLPNRPVFTAGQDSMKLYDYAARARPVVATRMRVPDDAPPALVLAADAAAFAAGVLELAASGGDGNRAWAEANNWSERLPRWLHAATGR